MQVLASKLTRKAGLHFLRQHGSRHNQNISPSLPKKQAKKKKKKFKIYRCSTEAGMVQDKGCFFV